MKIIKATFVLLAILTTSLVNAQTSIQPFESTVYYENAQRPAIQINLDPEPFTLKKAWKEYLKDNYDFKLRGIGFLSNKDILSAEAIMVEQVSSKQMDFYTRIVEDENGSEMKVFVSYGYDVFLTREKNPTEYEALTGIMDSFLKYYLPKYYESRVNDTEKRIKELTNEKDDLEEEISDDSARITKLKKQIEGLEKESKSNNELLKAAKTKLTKRTEKLTRIRKQLRKL